MNSGSKPFGPNPTAPKKMTIVPTTATVIRIAESSRNAPARLPALASLTPRSTPSGVTSERASAVDARALLLAMEHHASQVEIGEPESQHAAADRIARDVAGDGLPADAFEHAGEQEHDGDADHGRGRNPAGACGSRQ